MQASDNGHSDAFVSLQPILAIVQACIWSGLVNHEKPVSCLLVAEQESGKTECLKYYRGTRTLQYIADITSRGLEPFKHDIEASRLRHLVILDLVRIVNHGRGVSDRLIQTLASLMEEGEGTTSDAGGLRQWKDFPRIGCLMSITPKYFSAKAGNWRKTGFLSRFLCVRFNYSADTVHKIHNAIKNGHLLPKPVPEQLPDGFVNCEVSLKHATTIANTAESLGKENRLYGFRYHRALRTLSKALAIRAGRSKVIDEDVDTVLTWAPFFGDKEVTL